MIGKIDVKAMREEIEKQKLEELMNRNPHPQAAETREVMKRLAMLEKAINAGVLAFANEVPLECDGETVPAVDIPPEVKKKLENMIAWSGTTQFETATGKKVVCCNTTLLKCRTCGRCTKQCEHYKMCRDKLNTLMSAIDEGYLIWGAI